MSSLVSTADPVDDELLLDLLNTTPTTDGVHRDTLDEKGAARAWLTAHGGRTTPRELASLRATRTVLQGVVRGDRPSTALAPFVAEISYRAAATGEGLTWTLDVAPENELGVRALLAWDRLRMTAPGRLRACANDECTLYLLDRSKANTARWCSMAVCGNRMKARRHYQRQRGSQD